MRVSIKDFQIIKSASLEFVPGLTVIQGESNNGKSALFRAIKSCIYNEPGTTNVRMGCKNYIVGIESKNHKIILQKGENSLYLIDGKQYNKIGKSQVPEVAQLLGISALSINDGTEKINFWDQMEKPFLLDRNSSELFRFIVDSGEDDNLNSTLRSMVSDKNKLNVDKNLKEGSIATLKQQIDTMENTLAGSKEKIQLCENIISFSPMTSKLVTTNNTITNITNKEEEIEETNTKLNKQRELSKEIENKLNTLSYNISKKEQLDETITKYNTVNNALVQLNDILKNKVDFKEFTHKLDKIITDKSNLGVTVEKIENTSKLISTLNTNRIEITLGQDKINKLSTLNQVIERISYLQNQLVQLNVTKENLDKEYEPFINEYKSIDLCPYCGNKLHKEGGC